MLLGFRVVVVVVVVVVAVAVAVAVAVVAVVVVVRGKHSLRPRRKLIRTPPERSTAPQRRNP